MARDWAGHIPADPWLIGPAYDDTDLPAVRDLVKAGVDETCPVCKGVGAVAHDTRNPELVEDCTRCGGDGTVPARPAYDGGEAA